MEPTRIKTEIISSLPATFPGAGGKATQSVFIAAQSLGDVLRNSMALYRGNFRPLFLAYVLPTFPFLVVQQLAQSTKNTGLFVSAIGVSFIVSIATIGAITITIADICLGNTPSVRRSYQKLLQGGLWLRLLLSSAWQLIVTLVGLLFLIVPGFILSVRLLFTANIVVLERRSGNAALKRSFDLSKGHSGRLGSAVIILMGIYFVAPALVLSIVAGVVGYVAASHGVQPNSSSLMFPIVLLSGITLLIYPLFFIAIVLLYYDLRVRKEAYDVAALSEDMMR